MRERCRETKGDGGGALVRGVVLPTLGMALFWPFFRYASFVRLLYPAYAVVHVGDAPVRAHIVFLAALSLLLLAAIAGWRAVEGMLERRRPAVAALMCVGAVGAAVALGVDSGALPVWLLWVSAALTALGFLASYMAWAFYFSHSFRPLSVAVLGVSLFASYVLLSRGSLAGLLTDGAVDTVLMPFGTGLCWFFSRPLGLSAPAGDPPRRTGRDGRVRPRLYTSVPILVVVSFLVVGAAVRGIVDLRFQDASSRVGISIALSALVMLACCLFYRDHVPSARTKGGGSSQRPLTSGLVPFALTIWVALSLVFLAGLFAFLALNAAQIGGDAVVVARTLMELVLWLLLCSLASERRLSPVPLFLVWGVAVEVVSWMLSYVLVPEVLGRAGSEELASHAIVLAVMFGIVALVLAGFGVHLARPRARANGEVPGLLEGLGAALYEDGVGPTDGPGAGGAGTDPGRTQATEPSDGRVALVEKLVGRGGLTRREAMVVVLYAHGFSLGKVAEELGISKSTAQSHIKNAYRKLDVHSRDELIEREGLLG